MITTSCVPALFTGPEEDGPSLVVDTTGGVEGGADVGGVVLGEAVEGSVAVGGAVEGGVAVGGWLGGSKK